MAGKAKLSTMAVKARLSADTATVRAGSPLRRRAEKILRKRPVQAPLKRAAILSAQHQQTIHNLQVHEIELEMQNEALRRAEAQTESARARYFDLYNLAPVGYVSVGAEGKIVEANFTAGNLLGVSRNGLLEKPLSRFIAKTDQDLHYLRRKQLVAGGAAQTYDLRLRRGDGTQFRAQVSATLSQADATGSGICLAFSDVSERYQREEDLELMRQRLSLAQAASGSGVWDWNIATGEMVWSAELFDLFGLEPATTGAGFKVWRSLLHPDDRQPTQSALRKAMAACLPLRVTYRIVMPSGPQRWISTHGDLTYDAQGKPLRMIGICLDVTESKGAEIMLREQKRLLEKSQAVAHEDIARRRLAEDEMRKMNMQMSKLAARLNALHEQEYGVLSRELHDEFGQLLSSLKMDLSVIAMRLSGTQPDLQARINATLALVDASMQSVRRIAARLRPRILDELGMLPAIEWLVQDFRERTGINAVVVADQKVVALVFTQEQATGMFRIVQESLTNVLRHAAAHRVDISLHYQDGWLALEIRDDGRGMDEAGKNSYMSIGLLGMRERALAMGGELTINSVRERGTFVTLRLQLKETGK